MTGTGIGSGPANGSASAGPSSGPGSGPDGGSTNHRKGHRRQESMYAMTGLYSETVPEEDSVSDTKSAPVLTNYCHDTVIKCHSRNPSTGFDR